MHKILITRLEIHSYFDSSMELTYLKKKKLTKGLISKKLEAKKQLNIELGVVDFYL